MACLGQGKAMEAVAGRSEGQRGFVPVAGETGVQRAVGEDDERRAAGRSQDGRQVVRAAGFDAFGEEAESAESVLFFYSGHAFQMNGVNYLVPVDAALASREAVLQERGIDPAVFTEALAPAPLDVRIQERARGARPGTRLTFIVVVSFMLMTIFTAMSYIFASITGEKQIRVTEQVLSAIPAQTWIDGKILGTTLFVLAYLVSYAVGFALAFAVRGAFEGEMPRLPSLVTDPGVLLVTLVAAALGFGLWFTVFAAVAATVSDPTTSSRGGFIMLPGLALSVGFLGHVGNVDGALFRFFALFPFTSPSALPVRMLTGSIAAWEVLAALALLAGSVLLARSAAAKVFALGIHMTGKEPSLAEVWRWVRKGGGAGRG